MLQAICYMRLTRQFFLQPTLRIAKELLGTYIIHKIDQEKIIGKIVETEAYIGPYDRASHAYGYKRTPRNRAEYMIGGHIYIYLIYGIYWQLNISTCKEGKPECILIRSLEPISLNSKSRILNSKKVANGPGKLCNYLKLNKSHYGLDVCSSKEVWLEKGEKVESDEILVSARIGIDYAGKWALKPWRFYIKNNPFVSVTG